MKNFGQPDPPSESELPRNILFQITTAIFTSTQAGYAGPAQVITPSLGYLTRISALWVSQNDTVAHSVQFNISRDGSHSGFTRSAVAAGAGNSAAVPMASILSTLAFPGFPPDGDGIVRPCLTLLRGEAVTVSYATTLSTGAVINIFGLAKDIAFQ